MASKTDDDRSTSSADAWWFLNPGLSQLAKPALALVTQWTWHEKTAKELLWEGAARGFIRWYAEIEIQENNPVFKTRAGLLTFNRAVKQGLWHRDYFSMDWEVSRGIYLGPAILLMRNPECLEEVLVRYDGRASVRIVARLMRFHRGDMAADARRRGLLSAPSVPSPVSTSEVSPSESSPQGQSTGEEPQGGQNKSSVEPAKENTKTRIVVEARRMKRDGEIPEDIIKTKFAATLASKAGVGMKHVRNHLKEWGLWPISAIDIDK
jgi:hypothetical protein